MTGDTRLRLFPIVVKTGDGQCLVIRRDTGKMLRTSASGVESIKLLRKGLTIDRTRAVIGARYGCPADEVDIMPLIDALLAADFVKAVDGRALSAATTTHRWPAWRVYAHLALVAVMSLVMRWAPMSVSVPIIMRPRQSRDAATVGQIAHNMRRVPALAHAPPGRAVPCGAPRFVLGADTSEVRDDWIGQRGVDRDLNI